MSTSFLTNHLYGVRSPTCSVEGLWGGVGRREHPPHLIPPTITNATTSEMAWLADSPRANIISTVQKILPQWKPKPYAWLKMRCLFSRKRRSTSSLFCTRAHFPNKEWIPKYLPSTVDRKVGASFLVSVFPLFVSMVPPFLCLTAKFLIYPWTLFVPPFYAEAFFFDPWGVNYGITRPFVTFQTSFSRLEIIPLWSVVAHRFFFFVTPLPVLLPSWVNPGPNQPYTSLKYAGNNCLAVKLPYFSSPVSSLHSFRQSLEIPYSLLDQNICHVCFFPPLVTFPIGIFQSAKKWCMRALE